MTDYANIHFHDSMITESALIFIYQDIAFVKKQIPDNLNHKK